MFIPSNRPVPGSGQISIFPKPELRGFWWDSFAKPPFGVTSAEVVIICPDGSQIGTTIEQEKTPFNDVRS